MTQSQPVPAPTAPRRRLPRRVARGLLFALGGLVLLGMTGWMALAVCYADLHTAPPRKFLALIVAIAALSVAAFVRPRRRGLVIFAAMFAGVLAWYFSIRPNSSLEWLPDVARMPHATIEGDLVHLHDIRNFDYRSENDFTPGYYDRTLDLKQIKTADLILSYWSGRAIAHAMLSFGFDDGQYIAISIETRKEKGEQYSTIEGFFRQYELIYVVADERDLIRLRTNYRNEEVYIFRGRVPVEKVRAVFLDYLDTVNTIHKRPRFYNALTENCTTSIFAHLRCAPPYPPFTPGVLLSGYSAEYGYKSGGLDHSVSFEELERRGHINDLAKLADQAPDFSRRIRARLTDPQPPNPLTPDP
ncbi:MAG TPA: DUF4105 domain-containing protein [Phycisphaerae bacterium]|nr:DUF4105 domain-containing protein [Phycisphaerae bacterium]